jgi:glycosyltransferase 2 family protein
MWREKKFWIGLACSLGALAWAMHGVDWGRLAATLAAGRWWWLGLSLPLYLVGYYSRAARVSQLLEPIKRIPASRVLPALVVGFLFNNVLPLRLGEFVFAYLLGTREKIPRTASFAVVVFSRILDGITIVAFFLVGLFAFLPAGGFEAPGMPSASGSRADLLGKVYLAGIAGAVIFGLVALACILLIARKDLALRLVDVLLRVFPEHISAAGRGAVEKFIGGLGILRDPGKLFGVFLFNFIPWGLELGTYYLGARVFGLDLTLRQSALVMGMTNLAMILPAGPGGLGLFEGGGMTVMSLLGVEKATGFAYIVMVHAIILLPINLWGAWYLWREGISFADALSGGGTEIEKKKKRDG